QAVGIPKVGKPTIRDGPGRLLRFLGDVEVTGHEEGDPRHVVVVRSNDPGEGHLIAGDGALDDRRVRLGLRDHDFDHALQMPPEPASLQVQPGRRRKVTRWLYHASMTCRSCGRAMDADARFCPGCGAPVQLACSNCGASLAADARFCPSCGTPTTAAS